MRPLMFLLCLVTNALLVKAQNLPVKLYELSTTQGSDGRSINKPGRELKEFKIPAGANSLKMRIEVYAPYQKVKVLYQLRLSIVTTDGQSELQNVYWNPLVKDSALYTDCYFPAGDYVIHLADNNDTSIVFAARKITILPNGSATSFTANGYSYDRSKFKIWVCKSVDESTWKAIGQTSAINAGSCITFFFESQEKIKNPGTMRWKLYKLDADGKEVFVNQRDQNTVLPEWRKLYYEECDEFKTKGKYRIYFAIKNESEAYYGVQDKDYFAKADLQAN